MTTAVSSTAIFIVPTPCSWASSARESSANAGKAAISDISDIVFFMMYPIWFEEAGSSQTCSALTANFDNMAFRLKGALIGQ